MFRGEGIIDVFEPMIAPIIICNSYKAVIKGNRKVLNREKVNEITDRVEEQLLRQKATVFKDYWYYQLIIEKKQRQKCSRCPFFCFCFPDFGVCFDEGYKFNKRAIEGFCRDKELKGTIRRLNKIMETEGHQSHDWSDPLKNKWYEEMKREAEMEEYRKQHRKPIYDRWWRLKFRLFGKQPKTCPYCGGKLKENGLEGHNWRLWCSNCERTLISI